MSAPLLDPRPVRPAVPASRPGRRRLVHLSACVALVLAACGDDGGGGSAEGPGPLADLPEVADSEYEDLTGQGEVTIDTRDNTFAPQYATVSPGTEVTFSNRGRNPHNVIAVEASSFVDIPTQDLGPGDAASIQFDEPGDYPYYCSLHATPSRGMTGRIRVTEE